MENNESTALLAKADSLGGPQISGSVQVPLMELDQLRANYVNAVKAYKELALHVKEVRVVLVDGDDINNKVAKGTGKRESISWKNMDEIRSIVANEERGKLEKELAQHNTRAEEAHEKMRLAESALSDLKLSMLDLQKKHREQIKEKDADIKNLNLIVQEKNNEITELKKLLEETINQANEQITQNEKLKAQFDDISHKYVALQEEKGLWWKFW